MSDTSEPTRAIEWYYTVSGALLAKINAGNPVVSGSIIDRTDLRVRVHNRLGGVTQDRVWLNSDGGSDWAQLQSGTYAARPAASTALYGVYYLATDRSSLYYCTGSAWTQVFGTPDAVIQPSTGFSNSFINYTTGGSPMKYWKDSNGFVHLVGEINSSGTSPKTPGAIVYGFPAGYRPPGRFLFLANSNAGNAVNHFEMQPGGNLVIDNNFTNVSDFSNFGHVMWPTVLNAT